MGRFTPMKYHKKYTRQSIAPSYCGEADLCSLQTSQIDDYWRGLERSGLIQYNVYNLYGEKSKYVVFLWLLTILI